MFRQRITNEYLKARSEYRAKGKGARQLRFDEFITWKLEKENKKE
jgi:hypothetical protein